MHIQKATAADLPKAMQCYEEIINKTPDIEHLAMWRKGQHPTEETILSYINKGEFYILWDHETIAGMMALANGISDNENTVLDKVKGLAGGISALTQAAVATPATATTSTVNNSTSSVVQNNNFNNSFTGGTAETQKNVSKAMKKSAYDATSYMAKGLSYARG